MMTRTGWLAALALTLWQTAASAQMAHNHGSDAACDETALRCASKVTPSFAPNGTLWLVWMAGGQLSVARSSDQGRSFDTPVQVTTKKLDLDWGPDARPKIVVTQKGDLALAFSIFQDKAFNGQVLTTRSTDGGKTFDALRPITTNTESQRFEALGLDADGTVFAAWLDKRNRVPAKARGEKYDGAGLFFASSRDGGGSYSDTKMATDNTCECCRLGLAFAGPGKPVVIFRNIFAGGVRDHAVMTFSDLATPGDVRRVSTDDWQIAACPHHGPSLAISPSGSYHATWYTSGKARKGLFYARSQDQGVTFSDPVRIGRPDRNASRPYVLAGPRGLIMVWKEFDGETTAVTMMTSHNDGATWSQPTALATTKDTSDHPLLVSDGKRTFLSWMTKADGYRIQPIEGE